MARNIRSNSLGIRSDTWSKEICFFPKSKLEQYKFDKRISCYLIGKKIAYGLYATVHEGMHIITGEKVAVKALNKQKLQDDFYASRHIYREAKILRYVNHPRIIQLLETFETDNHYYITTELVSNTSILDLLEKNGKFTEEQTKKYIKQMLEATDYLHAQDIIHRDLKLENVLLDEDDNIKIIDFGLSTTTKTRREKANVFFIRKLCQSQRGSPAYVAPELLAREEYGPKVDVWSIGVNMFAMLTASLPFTTTESTEIADLYQKIVNFQINPVPDNLSEDAIDLMFKFLTVNPRERISLSNAKKHSWLSGGHSNLHHLESFNGSLVLPKDIDKQIIKAMHKNLGLSQESIARAIKLKIPSYASAIFKLNQAKIQRYHRKLCRNIADDLSEFRTASSKPSIQSQNDNTKTKAIELSIQNDKIESSKKAITLRRKSSSKKAESH